jgi:hypothetical protein
MGNAGGREEKGGAVVLGLLLPQNKENKHHMTTQRSSLFIGFMEYTSDAK